MILPVTFGAGPSAAALRPHPEDAALRLENLGRAERAAAGSGESRVHISPAGAQRAQAEAQTSPPAPQPSGVPEAATSVATTAATPAATPVAPQSALDLAFAAADGNRDGTVTISEQKTYEVRTVRINIQQPSDGRPGPAGSGPIRAYLDVGATIASI